MNRRQYWRQQRPLILLHAVCMAALSLFLLANALHPGSILLILTVWAAVAAGTIWAGYFRRQADLNDLLSLLERLEERYLLPEIIEPPEDAVNAVWYQILRQTGKSMLEQVEIVRRERLTYQEDIEQWIHEIKTPLTALKLLCENNRAVLPVEFPAQLEKLSRLTEQVLYYARSEHTEKDYFVQKLRLFDPIHQALADNKYLLLRHHVRIELHETADFIFADEKWLRFILTQLIANAVQYRSEHPVLRFSVEYRKNLLLLSIEDNGVGIDPADLPRIFEKGFTGKNGRKANPNATGFGLYLCRRLCDRLGLGICIQSRNSGTAVQIIFHQDDYLLQTPLEPGHAGLL